MFGRTSLKHIMSRIFLQLTVFQIAIWLTMLIVIRLVFIFIYIPMSVITENLPHLPLALRNIVRFDSQVCAYAAVPLLLLGLPLLVVANKRLCRFFTVFTQWYSMVVVMAITLLGCVDLGFYHNFGSHINSTFFDFFKEGPLSLIESIWNEYPVIRMIAIIIGCLWTTWRVNSLLIKNLNITEHCE